VHFSKPDEDAMGDVVIEWSPLDAGHLQRAMRLTNEAFAERLGSAVRTVAKWHANPQIHLTLEMQQALDVMLTRASPDEQERFHALRVPASPAAPGSDAGLEEWGRRLAEARHLHSAMQWLNQRGQPPSQPVAERVIAHAARRAREATTRHTDVAKGEVGSDAVGSLRSFYLNGIGDHGFLDVIVDATRIPTSMLVHEGWLGLAQDLDEPSERFRYDPAAASAPTGDAALDAAAVARLGDVLVDGTRFTDGELYRLTRVAVGPTGLEADFGTGSFAQYALTWDLLESETLNATRSGTPPALPLRRRMLPDVASVLDPGSRLCMGGVLALTAFARAATDRHPADYVLLVQERGDKVVNASRRLAVVPKCFHEPAGDPGEDADIRQSLVREFEEELLGREELDTTVPGAALAEPLHPTRLTEPARWLIQRGALRLELTAFGFNVVSGNFELPCLVQVADEEFWQVHGGAVVANWEVARLRRVSSMDSAGLARLIHDPAWSSEGLYAFVAGLLRLAQVDPSRVRLPHLEMGVTR
jgi:hypothetical protein